MLRPEPHEFVRLAAQGNLIPVVREILADLDTPLSLFRALDDGETSFLLESVEGGEKWARYSFVGSGARAIFRARGRAGGVDRAAAHDALRGGGRPARAAARAARRVPAGRAARARPAALHRRRGRHDRLRLGALRRAHPRREPRRARTCRISGSCCPRRWSSTTTCATPRAWSGTSTCATARDPLAALPRGGGGDRGGGGEAARPARGAAARRSRCARRCRCAAAWTARQYAEVVKRAKEYVVAGDIFQVVLGFRHTVPLQVDPFTLYRQLRLVNPSPYLFFVRMRGAGADRLVARDPGAARGAADRRAPDRGHAPARPRRRGRASHGARS